MTGRLRLRWGRWGNSSLHHWWRLPLRRHRRTAAQRVPKPEVNAAGAKTGVGAGGVVGFAGGGDGCGCGGVVGGLGAKGCLDPNIETRYCRIASGLHLKIAMKIEQLKYDHNKLPVCQTFSVSTINLARSKSSSNVMISGEEIFRRNSSNDEYFSSLIP